jgi:hypothetical protein
MHLVLQHETSNTCNYICICFSETVNNIPRPPTFLYIIGFGKKEMTEEFVGILVSCLILSPVICGNALDENPKKFNHEKGEGNKVFLKLYEQCIKMDTEACVGYKLLSTSWSYLHNTTFLQSDDATENGAGRQELEEHVNDVLLQKFVQFLTPFSLWSPFSATHTASRK